MIPTPVYCLLTEFPSAPIVAVTKNTKRNERGGKQANKKKERKTVSREAKLKLKEKNEKSKTRKDTNINNKNFYDKAQSSGTCVVEAGICTNPTIKKTNGLWHGWDDIQPPA